MRNSRYEGDEIMKAYVNLFPTISDNQVLVQFTSNVILDKLTLVSVPSEFYGIIYADEKPLVRLEPVSGLKLLKHLGKKYVGKNIKIGFVRKNDFPYIPWGFGDIDVKNEKLKETYRVGANGKYLLKLIDPLKLIHTFGTDNNIDIDMLSAKTKLIISTIGKPLLSKYFAGTKTSVFEINSLLDDLRTKMFDEIRKESIFKDSGLELEVLTINGIHVNEEDMELIRKRINTPKEPNQIPSNQLDLIKEEILKAIRESNGMNAKEELEHLKEDVARIAENQAADTVIDEIDNIRSEVISAINSKPNNIDMQPFLDLVKDMSKKYEESISEIKAIIENNEDERIQNQLPLFDSAKEDWLKNLKLTTDLQLEKAESDDDYAGVAGLIYSNVEANLIEKFKVSHKDRDFYMSKEEFDELSTKFVVNNEAVYRNSYKARPLYFKDIEGSYVEMPVEIRFYKAGLSIEEAVQAAKDWTLLNKFRHRSEENKVKLDNALLDRKMDRKEYLKYLINSYRKYGLFTRE